MDASENDIHSSFSEKHFYKLLLLLLLISPTFYFREQDDGIVEAVDDYEGGNDSLLYAIRDYDRDRAQEAENKARKAGEKARREAEEHFRTSAENKEDDPEEEFTTASLLKEQKALEQRKAEREAYGKIIFEDVIQSKIMLELKLFEFSKEDLIENETSKLDDSIEIDDEKENGTYAQEKEMEEQI